MIRGRTGPTPPRNEADGSGQSVIVAPMTHTSSLNQVIQSTNSDQTIGNIKCENADSDSEECLFVCAKKPPHLRTPEYVELLNSDSDSDVVFVSSEKMPTLVLPESDESNAKVAEPSTSATATVIKTTKSTPPKAKGKKRKLAGTKATAKRSRSSVAAEPSSSQVQWFIPARSTRRTRRSLPNDTNIASMRKFFVSILLRLLMSIISHKLIELFSLLPQKSPHCRLKNAVKQHRNASLRSN